MRTQKWLPYAVVAGVYITLAVVVRLVLIPEFSAHRGLSQEARRYFALNHQVTEDAKLYRDQRVLDSILPLIPRHPGLFVSAAGLDSSSVKTLRHSFERTLPEHVNAAIPVFGVPVMYGAHSEFQTAFSRVSNFSGVVDGQAYCAIALPTWHDDILEPYILQDAANGRVLGSCRLWAKYGAPGTRIAHWLQYGGERFARSTESFDRSYYTARSGGNLFGVKQDRWWASLPGQACMAGDEQTCENAVLGSDSLNHAKQLAGIESEYWIPNLFFGESTMLAALERSFGEQRFSAFWQSQEPLPRAFQAAFGVSLGHWVHDWLSNQLGPMQAGPRLSGASVLLSLLLMGLFVGVGIGIARRRAV